MSVYGDCVIEVAGGMLTICPRHQMGAADPIGRVISIETTVDSDNVPVGSWVYEKKDGDLALCGLVRVSVQAPPSTDEDKESIIAKILYTDEGKIALSQAMIDWTKPKDYLKGIYENHPSDSPAVPPPPISIHGDGSRWDEI